MRFSAKTWLASLGAALFLLLLPAAHAAEESGGTPAAESKPDAAKPDAAKPDEAKDEKPDGDEGKDDAPGAGGEAGGSARLKDLVSDGFVIRTTVFIPADAVTRQLGKVSSDAIVMTLQKSTSTAVCYYTFKAYVAEGLNAIPSCIVHR